VRCIYINTFTGSNIKYRSRTHKLLLFPGNRVFRPEIVYLIVKVRSKTMQGFFLVFTIKIYI